MSQMKSDERILNRQCGRQQQQQTEDEKKL
jgi:hypothetical protein